MTNCDDLISIGIENVCTMVLSNKSRNFVCNSLISSTEVDGRFKMKSEKSSEIEVTVFSFPVPDETECKKLT